LGSKNSWRRLGRTGASPKTTPAPKSLSKPLSDPLVEMQSVSEIGLVSTMSAHNFLLDGVSFTTNFVKKAFQY
jgi:hypothetical protein